MTLAALFAVLALAQDPAVAAPAPGEEARDPIEAADQAEAAADRAFGGAGASPVTTLGVSAPSTPPEQLYRPPAVRPFEMPATLPPEPIPYGGVAADLPDRPVPVEQYRRSYEPPPGALESYYERGLRAAFDSAQARHGPLDGQWVVSAADGGPLYSLLIADPGPAAGEIEGAWRDLAAPAGALPSATSGVLLSVSRDGAAVELRFYEAGASEPSRLRLERSGEVWRGRLHGRDGARAVVMRPG